MVFQQEAQFQQFVHCKFRENIIRMLYIPSLEHGNIFLVVNKFGKIGLYHPEKFTLIHTYVLDLIVPMHPQMPKSFVLMARRNQEFPPPKCQRSHLVIDACFAPDINSLVFITTRSILQWYDIGEIETQNIGLELFPRKRYLALKKGKSPVPLVNKGHVETHRVFGLRESPTCMEYYSKESSKAAETSDNKMSKLLIGDAEGCVTILLIDDPRKPLGFRKIRGVLHEIRAMDLVERGHLMVYKAHNEAVNEIRLARRRQLIISCSRDTKFSLFLKDFTETVDPYIISLPQGVNCFSYSDTMRLIATGSDDHLVRLFNQFVVKMPQVELTGHRSPITAIKFLSVHFWENSLLLSFAKDVEIRAWNPIDFTCLQSLHISFPIRSTIMCKTPEFAKRSLFIFQPHHDIEAKIGKPETDSKSTASPVLPKGSDGQIIALYCNSFAVLQIEKETSYWPFDFEDFITEFQEATSTFEKKIRLRQQSVSQNPKIVTLSDQEIQGIEKTLDSTVKEVLKIKRNVDKQLGLGIVSSPQNPGLSIKISEKLQAMRNRSESEALSKEMFAKQGAIFRSYPIYDLPPIKFVTNSKDGKPKSMPVTDLMKAAGIHEVKSVEDILTGKARKCFAHENMRRKHEEDVFFLETTNSSQVKSLDGTEDEDEGENVSSVTDWGDGDDMCSSENDFNESEYQEYLETSLQKLSEFQSEVKSAV